VESLFLAIATGFLQGLSICLFSHPRIRCITKRWHWLLTVTSHLIIPPQTIWPFLRYRHPAGMTSQISLVLDDTSDVFSYGGGAWKTNKASRWFNGSTQYPAFVVAGNGLYGTMNLTFNG
jgi:hypothetical protein